jgi:uncharacterized protein YhbP (UPF0306 family)
MTDSLQPDVAALLAQHNSLTLAYADADGPGACGVWFAADAHLLLYFLSAPSTRHGRALRDGGEVAFAIHKDDQDWRAIRGLQGRGRCAPVRGVEAEHGWHAYIGKYPFVARQFADLEAALASAWLWRITPRWLRLIDNARGFGSKREIILGE